MKSFAIGVILFLIIASCSAVEREGEVRLGIADQSGTSLEQKSSINKDRCPANMVEVKGMFCPSIVQECINLDKTIHNANGFVHCLEFAPTRCIAPKEKLLPMDFCIDQYEFPNKKGEKPEHMVSWNDMTKSCQAIGKRLCLDTEWMQACEGDPNSNEIVAYPYGNIRDDTACNIDKPQKSWFDASKMPMTKDLADRLDQSEPSGNRERCVSKYGVYDLTGNEDESVINTEPGASNKHYPWISGLVGGAWILGHRNRCNTRHNDPGNQHFGQGAETNVHSPDSVFYEFGGRCCKDIK